MSESDSGACYDSCMEVNMFLSVLLFNLHICQRNRKKMPFENVSQRNRQPDRGCVAVRHQATLHLFFQFFLFCNPFSGAIRFGCVCAKDILRDASVCYTSVFFRQETNPSHNGWGSASRQKQRSKRQSLTSQDDLVGRSALSCRCYAVFFFINQL